MISIDNIKNHIQSNSFPKKVSIDNKPIANIPTGYSIILTQL
jgi:hypothetical protein